MAEIDWGALSAVFPPDEVRWRIQGKPNPQGQARAVAYITARAVQERLDAVAGPANWSVEFRHAETGKVGPTVICRIGIRNDGMWVAKEDGAGLTEIEPEKGGISEAMRRAAVQWGIGRYLYAMPSRWVAVDGNRIADGEARKLAQFVAEWNQRHGGRAPVTGSGEPVDPETGEVSPPAESAPKPRQGTAPVDALITNIADWLNKEGYAPTDEAVAALLGAPASAESIGQWLALPDRNPAIFKSKVRELHRKYAAAAAG